MARVIAADDDANVLAFVRVVLEEAGHEVVEVSDGDDALRALREVGADLILTDLFMPGMDGLELLRALRRERPGQKVIAMSGGGFGGAVDLLTMARQLGAVEVVSKPFTEYTIRAAVERVLGPPADQ